MSKAQRNRQQNARERIAAQQAAAKRAEMRRRGLLAGTAVIAVIAVVVALIVIKQRNNDSAHASASNSSEPVTGVTLPASVNTDVRTVSAAALNTVGTGSVLDYVHQPVSPLTGSALTSSGKPEFLYIGAEYCPYCAAMRWAMAVALSKFGTLSTLRGIHSSSTDIYKNTATLTFYKSTYSSPYLTFTPVENETRTQTALQSLTTAQRNLWVHYSPNGETGYPFMDFGNRELINGPLYDPGVLAGLSWSQIAADLHDPSSKVAQGALGAANFITAAICKITAGKPGNVCDAPGVSRATAALG